MRKKLLDYFTGLLTLAEATRENKAEIQKLRREFDDLAVTVRLLANDQRHQMEQLMLRLENQLLRFEKRLPPSRPGK